MNIYLVSRTDDVDYDEYDSFVVVAENEDDALKLVKDNLFKKETVKIEKIATDKEQVVLGSFNAG